ncbi:hypothetical protein Asphe3_21200 [Pseudarthrobacter phenanthrenivorans Sphe3]|uniref:DUF4386 family protein n=1 Tax=Pseudarthrobacter phenanthrenivorans (strain DSM 18606 / JCM 16027 / LMG 23796 / Sphe3) TaxID=930171 RepID=F0M352_PSEPM|nr:hypothetical protein [Pseudarthrobacter phenanthrenivorans]ADX73273.1 hypothetical protein Asphe3_21200 [Pseudarthrobacter phenanthrenivorans Sphe3]
MGDSAGTNPRREAATLFGYRVAVAITVLTVLTFALALTALPDKVPYPFTDDVIAAQWPGDYYWLFPAMVLMLLFVALVAAVHEYAPDLRKIYGLLALCIAVIAAAVLLINYYIQAVVMPTSLQKGQLDGWSIFTQYNPHGIFIALEELGYLLMTLVFLCLAPIFSSGTRLERAIRWLFLGSFATAVASLAAVLALRGMDREDVFEIIIISIVWLTLIAAGILLALLFRRGTPRA